MNVSTDPDYTVLFEPDNPLPTFSFTDLPAEMREIVTALGWMVPTPVQAKAIPYLLEPRDLIVQARTGSGKTAAYLLPLLLSISPADRWCQALVLVPTRELARQVHAVLLQLTAGSDIGSALLYGGVGYGEQTRDLRDGAQIVIGTPGRILDHLYRGTFTAQRLRYLILDEADEMLSMGFYPAMRRLKAQLPASRNTYMFSATIPYHVESLAHEFLRHPDRLSLSKGTQSVTELDHQYYIVEALQKDRSLIRLIEMENPDAALIFCNTKRSVEYLAEMLKNHGYDARHLTGDLAQGKRERTMQLLREGTLRFLVATDVAARGIDISDLSHVFLYDIPEDTEVYVHRSGRTARAGKTGIAITLCENIEERKLLSIASTYRFEIEKRVLPTDEEIAARVAERLMIQLEDQLSSISLSERERIQRFLPMVDTLAAGEETRHLIALLLDLAYVQGLHQPLFQERSAVEPDAQPGPTDAAREGGDRKNRRSRSRKKEPRGEAPRAQERPTSETAT